MHVAEAHEELARGIRARAKKPTSQQKSLKRPKQHQQIEALDPGDHWLELVRLALGPSAGSCTRGS